MRQNGVMGAIVLTMMTLLTACGTSHRAEVQAQTEAKLEEPFEPVPLEFIAASFSRLHLEDMIGSRYVFHYDPNLGDVGLSIDELEPVLIAIERRLSPRGFTRVNNYDDADFALVVFAGFMIDVNQSAIPIFSGGERQRIEHEYQVPRFDNRGRYIGMRTQRDYEYYTTPRVQTGTQQVEHRYPHATITLGIDRSGAQASTNDLADNTNADWQFGESVLYLAHTYVRDEDPIFEHTAACLIDVVTDQFLQNTDHHLRSVPNRTTCQLDTTVPEDANLVIQMSPDPKGE